MTAVADRRTAPRAAEGTAPRAAEGTVTMAAALNQALATRSPQTGRCSYSARTWGRWAVSSG